MGACMGIWQLPLGDPFDFLIHSRITHSQFDYAGGAIVDSPDKHPAFNGLARETLVTEK